MDAETAARLLDTVAVLAVTLRYGADLLVFAFAYWMIVHD